MANEMTAKFYKKTHWSGNVRYQGVVVWFRGDVKNTSTCERLRRSKSDALDDARALKAELQQMDWCEEALTEGGR